MRNRVGLALVAAVVAFAVTVLACLAFYLVRGALSSLEGIWI